MPYIGLFKSESKQGPHIEFDWYGSYQSYQSNFSVSQSLSPSFSVSLSVSLFLCLHLSPSLSLSASLLFHRFHQPLPFLLAIYLLKKPGCLFYDVFHILDFADYISMMLFTHSKVLDKLNLMQNLKTHQKRCKPKSLWFKNTLLWLNQNEGLGEGLT